MRANCTAAVLANHARMARLQNSGSVRCQNFVSTRQWDTYHALCTTYMGIRSIEEMPRTPGCETVPTVGAEWHHIDDRISDPNRSMRSRGPFALSCAGDVPGFDAEISNCDHAQHCRTVVLPSTHIPHPSGPAPGRSSQICADTPPPIGRRQVKQALRADIGSRPLSTALTRRCQSS